MTFSLIQCCGRYFSDFLTGIDNIHLQMRYMYPKMISPSMYISHEDVDGVVLHYRTTRNGFCPYLSGDSLNYLRDCVTSSQLSQLLPLNDCGNSRAFSSGLLHQIAVDFYGIELSMQQLPDDERSDVDEGYRFRFRLNYNNRDYLMCRAAGDGSGLELEKRANFFKRVGNQDSLTPLSSSILLQLFPFTLVFKRDMSILTTGPQLRRLYPSAGFAGKPLADVARMRRPKVALTWDNVD